MPREPVAAGTWERVVAAYAGGDTTLDYLPRVLCVEPTNGCNFACTSCPRPDGKPDLLDVNDLIAWVTREQAAFRAAPVWVHFSGESLLHPKLDRIMRVLRERDVQIMLSTNASRLDDRRCEMLLAAGLRLIVFSLDAARAETYRRIRIGGDFAAVERNVRRFIALRGDRPQPITQAQLVISDQSMDEIHEFAHRWADQGIDTIHLKRYSTRAGQLAMPAPRAGGDTNGGDTNGGDTNGGDTNGGDTNGGDTNGGRCLDPWLNVLIRADGGVVPCCADFAGRLVLGSLHTQTLAEIWNGERARALRQAHVEGGPALPDACRQCSDVRTPADNESVTRYEGMPGTVAELAGLLRSVPRHLLFDVRGTVSSLTGGRASPSMLESMLESTGREVTAGIEHRDTSGTPL